MIPNRASSMGAAPLRGVHARQHIAPIAAAEVLDAGRGKCFALTETTTVIRFEDVPPRFQQRARLAEGEGQELVGGGRTSGPTVHQHHHRPFRSRFAARRLQQPALYIESFIAPRH